jgi:hypothetical protein
MFLQNVGIYQQVYMTPKPRTSSFSPPWKAQISHKVFAPSPDTWIQDWPVLLFHTEFCNWKEPRI